MTITIELPGELERELTAEAERLGLPVSEYALRVLAARAGGGASAVRSGADLVAFWEAEGVAGARSDITDPSDYARKLRHQAERRAP
jgi:hypothetical protein